MNQSDSTFELVKSLTQNEKRYFRVFTKSSGSDKNYLKVFDALDKMKTYDAKVLRKKLGSAKLNVSYEKNYLYKQLLKTLRTFYSENNTTIELQDILKNIEILYKKRLNAQCQQLVENGIALSKKYEQWNYHLEFIEWQYRIYGRCGNYKKLMVFEEEGLNEKRKLCSSIDSYAQVQKEIYDVLIIAQNQSVYAEKKMKGELRQTITKLLALLKKQGESFRISELIYSTLYLAAHYSGDYKGAYKYALLDYELYHNHPHFKNDMPFKFFVTIGNLVTRCINLKKFDEGLKYITELKLFVKQVTSFGSLDIQQDQHRAIFSYESRILLATNRHEEALKATKEHEKNYNHDNVRNNFVMTDSLNIARVYFVNELQRESLKRVNVLINGNQENVKLDFLTYGHLMRLCIQYDLNNHDVLEHLSQTVLRFLQKHNLDDDFAYCFVELMKKIGKEGDPKKHRQIFIKNLSILEKQVLESMDQYYDLVEWIERKLK